MLARYCRSAPQENLPSHGGIAEETTRIHRVGMPWDRVLPATLEPVPAAVEQKARQDLLGGSDRSGSRSKGGKPVTTCDNHVAGIPLIIEFNPIWIHLVMCSWQHVLWRCFKIRPTLQWIRL